MGINTIPPLDIYGAGAYQVMSSTVFDGVKVITMVQTSQMPKSIQSDIPVEAVGEALLQHYNVGITNPWYELGLSEQETYNRRKLPWADNNYSVSSGGNVSGPNASEIPEGLKQQWRNLARASRNLLQGQNFGDLQTMYDEGLTEVGDALRGGTGDMGR